MCIRDRFKISPDETLRIVQELYEKKLVTYPRTDARVLSTAVAKEIYKNISGLRNYQQAGAAAAEVLGMESWKSIAKMCIRDRGSSIMPQKKNPDIAELVRGKTGRVYGALTSILTTMKGIPLAYNKDMQEDKELTFDAIDTVKGCIALFTGMVSTMQFNKANMEASAKRGFTNATDAADYLVNHGVPFRDAHGIVGRLVLLCLDKGISLDELPLSEYKEISPVFEEDIYEAISMKTCVEKRVTLGAPGPDVMEQVIAQNKEYLEKN